MKVIFILNPISGTGRQSSIKFLLKTKINKSIDYQIIETEYAGHGAKIASENRDITDVIIAIGGDGTVLEVGSALIGSDTRLGIIPAGSGNGLARHLNIPTSLGKAIKVINNPKIKTIDTVTVNGTPFLSTMGIGFDAHIAKCFAEYGTRGFWSYIKLIFREYFKYIPKTFNIEIDGASFQKKAWIVCIANSSQYGNGAIISPESSIDDGILDFCTIQRPNLLQAPFFIARFFTGSLHKSSLIDSELGKSFLIKNNFELFHKDGEPIISNKELNIQINPLSLKVLVPNNYG
ncbi:MAG: YegS/Rv2252/BmrU family lipid kinase [Flavobacteriales bacterium]|jgi:diacylglycerol kinase (ATP)|nr:YegS/Rv2252/BmrU family lipid kinase [Flavobacteriales bacterium]